MEELLVCEETIQAMLEAEKCARDCSVKGYNTVESLFEELERE